MQYDRGICAGATETRVVAHLTDLPPSAALDCNKFASRLLPWRTGGTILRTANLIC
jgi:hypothetical protein